MSDELKGGKRQSVWQEYNQRREWYRDQGSKNGVGKVREPYDMMHYHAGQFKNFTCYFKKY